MRKRLNSLFLFVLILIPHLILSQVKNDEVNFRHSYINLGINLPQGNFGSAPIAGNTVSDNILSGYYGAQLGFVFELGKKYYFNKSNDVIRFGLDWTILSLTFNKMKWDDYATANGGVANYENIFSAASKIGPVVSFRITEKLIVDARVQIAGTWQASSFTYTDNDNSDQSFTLVSNNLFQNLGLKLNGGIGIRYGFIGLGLDYSAGNINTQYQPGNGDAIFHQKIKSQTLQIKLTLNH
jgi:hypothetical protein